jgi:hypothetical protein
VDRIIDHLELRFVADRPPPSQVFEQFALAAAFEITESGSLSSFSLGGRVFCPDWI